MICSEMNAQPSTADNDRAAWADGVLRRQVGLLEQLAQSGLRLALAIEGQVTGPSGAEPAQGHAPEILAMAFSRVSRAVRLACLLQSKLIRDADEARREADRQQRMRQDLDRIDANQARRDRKARVEAIVERVAWTETEDEDRTESLLAEAAERLDSDDIYGDVLDRPMGELVALICRDLGLEPDWDGLAQEAWAVKEGITANTAPLSSPLPLDGGEAGSGGDVGSMLNAQLTGHPHPRPFPHQGGRESALGLNPSTDTQPHSSG